MLKCCFKVASRVQTGNKWVVVCKQNKSCVTCDCMTRFVLKILERTVSEHALIDLIGFISIFFFCKELRPSLIATYPHESYERKNVHIMLFFSLHKTL